MNTQSSIQYHMGRARALLLAGLILLTACGGGSAGDDRNGEASPAANRKIATTTMATTTTTSGNGTSSAASRPSGSPSSFGDDAELDRLWTACADGDLRACDDLFFASPADTEYEEFGATCGGRIETAFLCVEAFDPGEEPPVTDPPPAGPVAVPDVDGALRLRQVSVVDPQIYGIEAFTMLVPDSWRFNGFVEWRHNIATLASGIVQLEDPARGWGLETYFLEPNAWTAVSLIGPGENWAGAIFRAPMSAVDYLVQVVVPTYRPGAVVIDALSMPDVAAVAAESLVAAPGAQAYADAARVRIRYEAGDLTVEEDFYTTIIYNEGGGIANWTPTQLYSLRAPAGDLDDATPLLQSILASTDVSLLWGANYQIVFDLFLRGQYQAIIAAGRLSEYIARTADEIAAIHREAWQNQQATYDRVFDAYSRYTRGVDRYPLGDGGPPVLLPRAATPCLERATNVPTVLLLPLTTPCPQGTDLLTPLSP